MTDTMVERVARALSKLPVRDDVDPGGELDQLRLREAARAAIAALREPTDSMIEAGWQDGNAGFGEGEEMAPIWRAMIDKALEEK